ncbi:type II toxin-antitoxin system PemK/MazF family toxin [Hansschlegelia zhihuaiae]|uniref:Type II toxin-antitoxin system PemK/MazF family toxin n=1 Tax=Hansschlegelia zhihuaiae TaxID=405005 RepID=A0A4Q0MNU7_9HYPH|nr:type II toxin-antitoxin system PemK/MazF family toxin [Hansschlegelia zhihuaiae]RXF75460.1 type II toxin-antitoxin system PemK/MazF family toxin [Hansschlegelia zhihuaiae]
MKRGDLVTVAFSGDLGKPRPALVVQSDEFEHTQSVTLLPLTTHLLDVPSLRIDVVPHRSNGLRERSQIMLDKISSLHRSKVGARIGALDEETLGRVDRALASFLGLA